MKRAALYSRVSSEEQAKGDAVSLDRQLADMKALCQDKDWEIAAVFVDCSNYRATQQPKKGKVVNPSGERADRPQFLAMLDLIKSGQVDIVLCWRDDRIMRHPRVAVILEDTLDLGDSVRNGAGKIELYEATGAPMDRMMLHIKAVLWREENRRRAERMKMAKIGTLKDGRWPGGYNRFGYTSKKEEGRRGRVIELGDPEQVRTVKDVYNWYDAGLTLTGVRKKLLDRGAEQYGYPRKHEWSTTVINQMLRAEDYCGRATWQFGDGGMSIEIPAIVSREQWERVQKRLDNAQNLSPRNAKNVYLLQNIAWCGECGGKIGVSLKRVNYYTRPNGERVRYEIDPPRFRYRCCLAMKFNDEGHPHPYSFKGHDLEWAVWRYIVDNGIKRPDIIHDQVVARQKELIAQGESVDGDIARIRSKLDSLKGERAAYQRQMGRCKIDEDEFDERMDETAAKRTTLKDELLRLKELRDDATKVQAGLDYANELMKAIRESLEEIDVHPYMLNEFPDGERRYILQARQRIIRALCDKVIIFSDGRVKIEGVLDGSEAMQFARVSRWTPLSLPAQALLR